MNIITTTIEYKVGENTHKAYLAQDESINSPKPGVIIVHEWWGVNDHVQKRAHMLAELGYVALAIDMYGDGKIAKNPDEAASLMNGVLGDMEKGTDTLRAAYQLLLDQTSVDSNRTAAIGYCFGGAMVLHMARIGLPLIAVASFHGALGSFYTAEPGSIGARILVAHGGADSMITMDDLAGFKKEMDTAQADYETIIYEGAKHGFTNPEADTNARKYGLDLGYQAAADEASWDAMKSLFDSVFD